MRPADQDARDRAIDPSQSFIVQAPAGSGKTSLVTQRFLSLLCRVEHPENILSITFTRKAASEMRHRIVEALQSVAEPPPNEEHALKTYHLAQQVLHHDQQFQWNLLANPQRLRIQTIDSLCASLVKQMPLLAQLGAQPKVDEQPYELYQRAVKQFLDGVLVDGSIADLQAPVALLLDNLNNHWYRLSGMLEHMLACRDQWIRHFFLEQRLLSKSELELALQQYISAQLTELMRVSIPGIDSELGQLIELLIKVNPDSKTKPIGQLTGFNRWPGNHISGLQTWQHIANWLLTSDGKVRKSWNATVGALSKSRAKTDLEKQVLEQQQRVFQQVMEALNNAPDFVTNLHRSRGLPDPTYTEQQWQMIQAMNQCLGYLLALLRIEFKQQNRIDFVEQSLAASLALQDSQGVTDLALRLDYSIQHILVDEFQDTSHGQLELLEQLTEGWHADDGRTLFVVGDPMQSIYRFREADVGIYLKCQQQGLGNVDLQPLTLTSNFRSNAAIVDWVNQTFARVFPSQQNSLLGAVPISEATAVKPAIDCAVSLYHFERDNEPKQAEKIVDLVTTIRGKSATESIAVLVRGKVQAQAIIEHLNQARIAVEAVEMARLHQQPGVQLLANISCFITNTVNEIALVGILRSTLFGISLDTLQRLSDLNQSMWQSLNNISAEQLTEFAIDTDEALRLERFINIARAIVVDRKTAPLLQNVERFWYSAGGRHVFSQPTEQADVEQFFAMLEQYFAGTGIPDIEHFYDKIERLFSATAESDPNAVKIMTIHKSKGLEFDHVLLPHLEGRGRGDGSQLLLWQEFVSQTQSTELIVAPMPIGDKQQDKAYQLLKDINKEKQAYENGRLLYVAATRAKNHLYLLAESEVDDDRVKKPISSTLLHHVWFLFEDLPFVTWLPNTKSVRPNQDSALRSTATSRVKELTRVDFAGTIQFPESPIRFSSSPLGTDEQSSSSDEFDREASLVGQLVHRYLERFVKQGIDNWSPDRLGCQYQAMLQFFARSGFAKEEARPLVERVIAALTGALDDAKHQWIFQSYPISECEWSITTKQDNQFATLIIDRTFVDSNNIRWIIDYKTSGEMVEDEQFFSIMRKRYRTQMAHYRHAVARMESTNIHSTNIQCGLYLPIQQQLLVYSTDDLN